MKTFILRVFANVVVFFIVAKLLPGVHFNVWQDFVWAGLVMGLVNALIRPLVKLLAWPFTVVTLGLFVLAINLFMVYITDWLVSGMVIDKLLDGFILSLALWGTNLIIGWSKNDK